MRDLRLLRPELPFRRDPLLFGYVRSQVENFWGHFYRAQQKNYNKQRIRGRIRWVPIADGISLERLNFAYEISGDHPTWRPIRAFDDGEKVYLQFPVDIAQGELPPLFIVGAKHQAQLVNYRVHAPYYIVDRLFEVAELRLGGKNELKVRIERTGSRSKAANKHS